jgi:hypothetical protein
MGKYKISVTDDSPIRLLYCRALVPQKRSFAQRLGRLLFKQWNRFANGLDYYGSILYRNMPITRNICKLC